MTAPFHDDLAKAIAVVTAFLEQDREQPRHGYSPAREVVIDYLVEDDDAAPALIHGLSCLALLLLRLLGDHGHDPGYVLRWAARTSQRLAQQEAERQDDDKEDRP
jgi:hypothetical protein